MLCAPLAGLLQVHAYPNGIKQHPGVRVDEPVKCSIDSSLPLHYQFISRLEQHLRWCQGAQHDLTFRSWR